VRRRVGDADGVTRVDAEGLGVRLLHRDGLLMRAKADDARAVAVDHGAGRHHLGIKARPPRQDAMEGAAMPIRPVHHRGN
jgi:hypothetical protein